MAEVFHMPLEDVLDLWSGDYDACTVREVRAMMAAEEDAEFCWHADQGWDSCSEFIAALSNDMREHGWNGPPVCIVGRSLPNGHHRVLAAEDAGVQDIPYTGDWVASGGDPW